MKPNVRKIVDFVERMADSKGICPYATVGIHTTYVTAELETQPRNPNYTTRCRHARTPCNYEDCPLLEEFGIDLSELEEIEHPELSEEEHRRPGRRLNMGDR